ncbi:MAG: hypothetical protein HY352_01770 [Candidatus Omnitrophica bacterium]|nr:hypothetical protein [Candidatus Omnitrophota bacterium]
MNRDGFVYPLAIGVTFILTVLSATLLMRGVSELNISSRQVYSSAAFHYADAAVDQAAKNLRTPTDTTDDVMTTTYGNGSFTVDSMTALATPGEWQVLTSGVSAADPNTPRHIEAIYRMTPQSVFQFALFGANNVTVSGSAITDSYDSRLGPYEDDPGLGYNKDHHGDIGTNSTSSGGVTISGSIFIDGQVAVGPTVTDPTSIVTGYDASFITGGTSPASNTQDVVSMSQAFPMPPVVVPLGLTCSNHTVTGHTTETLSPTGGPLGNGTYCYNNLTVQGGGELTTSGPVTVYLTGVFTATGNTVVGDPSDPKAMTVLVSSTGAATLEGTITGSSEFYGALYGPSAIMTISGNADVYGSIVAQTVNVTGSASVHYDTALTENTTISNTSRATMVAWREL